MRTAAWKKLRPKEQGGRHGDLTAASMPPFRKTEVTDENIGAIAAYLAVAAQVN
jgi:mono/diheme cytochrome c family protein